MKTTLLAETDTDDSGSLLNLNLKQMDEGRWQGECARARVCKTRYPECSYTSVARFSSRHDYNPKYMYTSISAVVIPSSSPLALPFCPRR